MLRHVEGRSYEEIAATLDLPLGTVKTYIHRARHELRGVEQLRGDTRRDDESEAFGSVTNPADHLPETNHPHPSVQLPGDPMNHRHLLPDEIDLLLDDEVGFGVPPLKAHIRDCDDCRAQVDEARFVVDALEDVPHFAPSHTFADRVMAQVPVFVPWHVTARETVARWLPQSRPARIAVAALATSAASIVTVAMLWIATQTDVVALASGAAGDRVRAWCYDAGREVLSTVFGDQMFAIIQRTGTFGIAAALLGLVAAAAGSIAGLRALAAASSRRRA